MLEVAFREFFLRVVRLYYHTVSVANPERVPADGPAIVVSNHPNGLLDPLIMRIALRRPLSFLAKSTLFGNPFGRLAMNAFDAVPIYRRRDGEDTGQNNRTFDLCDALLGDGGWLSLFPEGTSHSDPKLKPFKTGVARIGLQAEAARGFKLGLKILPLGLTYEQKDVFRTRVATAVGEPIDVSEWAGRYEEAPRECVRALTQAVEEALAAVVLEADDGELWRGMLAVAAWTSPDGGADLEAQERRARALADGYQALMKQDPALADELVEAFRHFTLMLEAIGVEDPFSLEAPSGVGLTRTIAAAAPLLLLSPIAAVGTALGYLPYRLVKPLALKMAGEHDDLVSTMKVLLGATVMTVAYFGEAIVAGVLWGPLAGVATLTLAPLSGWVALRFDELLTRRREATRGWWARRSRTRVADAIAARRRELCARVEETLSLITSRAEPGAAAEED